MSLDVKNSISEQNIASSRTSLFAALLVLYALVIILWGAFVRFSGSGDGCGAHWPFCHGRFIPQFFEPEVFIEFFHRAKSGVFGLLVVLLVWCAHREFPARGLFEHPVRLFAWLALLFTTTEALIGAALVLFGWVGQDDSWQRVVVIGFHFLNTIVLLATLMATAWCAHPQTAKSSSPLPAALHWRLAVFVLCFVAVIATGSLASLSNTLYPTESLMQGIQADLDSSSPLLLRLRVIHPLLASTLTIVMLWLLSQVPGGLASRLRNFIVSLLLVNIAIGIGTLLTLSPLVAKLLHLLTTDLIWLGFCALLLSLMYPVQKPDSAPPPLS